MAISMTERLSHFVKNHSREILNGLASAGVSNVVEPMIRESFGKKTRADLEEPTDLTDYGALFLAQFPADKRKEAVDAAKATLEVVAPHSAAARLFSDLAEELDDATRDLMQRELPSDPAELKEWQRKTKPILRMKVDEAIKKAKAAATQVAATVTSNIPHKDTTVAHAHDDHGHGGHTHAPANRNEERAIDLTFTLLLAAPENALKARIYRAITQLAKEEASGDTANRNMLGRSRPFLAGCAIMEKKHPEILLRLLPTISDGMTEEAFLTSLRENPMRHGEDFVNAMLKAFDAAYPDPFNRHTVLERLDQAVDFHALNGWVSRTFGAAGAAGGDIGERAVARIEQAANTGLRFLKACGFALLVGTLLFVSGALTILGLSLTAAAATSAWWTIAFIALWSGLGIVFLIRLLAMVFDEGLALAAKPLAMAYDAIMRTDKPTTLHSITYFRDRFTTVTLVGFALAAMLTLVGAVCMTAVSPTVGGTMVLGFVGAVVGFALFGENESRYALHMAEPAHTPEEKEVRSRRTSRNILAARIGMGIMVTSVLAMLITGYSAVSTANACEATAQAWLTKSIEYHAVHDGRSLAGGWCSEHPNSPLCDTRTCVQQKRAAYRSYMERSAKREE